jgi:hypothetical protein
MHLFAFRSSKKKKTSGILKCVGSSLISAFFVLHLSCCSPQNVIANNSLSETPNEDQGREVSLETDAAAGDIVNPFNSTCYSWEGNIIPCDFKRPYAELLFDEPIPDPRFKDNQDGTVTDNLTGLVWLKNAKCFAMMDWESARQAAKRLKDGDCGPEPALVLSDGSSSGDWRLPTMNELCALIDFSRRDPALPPGQVFSGFPPGYYWSATLLDYHPGAAWIVYIESGTTCYEDIKNNAGHIWPVRRLQE